MNFNLLEIASAFIILFAVIDVLGSLPIIMEIKQRGGTLKPFQIASFSLVLLIAFLFIGEALLGLFGVDIGSFAIAGSLVLFVMAFEMTFGVQIFKHENSPDSSLVPIAFPLIAGAGTFTTLLSIRAEYHSINVIIALVLNIAFVYIVLKNINFMERIIGTGGIYVMKKFFGIILLAIAIKLFLSNIVIFIQSHF